MTKTKNKIVAIIIALIVIILIPKMTKIIIDNSISSKQIILKENGINLQIVSHEGYFNSTREVSIQIQDANKLLNWTEIDIQAFSEMLGLSPEYFSRFNGLLFKGTIKNTNIFPRNFNVSLLFDKLPNNSTYDINKKSILNKLIKALSLNLTLNTDAKITFVSLNDINVNNDNKRVKLLNYNLVIDENNYLTGIKNITVANNDKENDLLFYINNFEYDRNYIDIVTNNDLMKIEKINLESISNGIKIQANDYKAKAHTSNINNKVNMSFKNNLKTFLINSDDIDFMMDNFNFDMIFDDINTSTLKKLSNMQHTQYTQEEKEELALKLFTHGLSLSMKLNAENIINNKPYLFKFKAKIIDIDVKISVKKHINDGEFMKYITMSGLMKIDNSLVDLIPFIKDYNTKVVNSISNFDLKYIDEKLYINDKKVN
jgi:hypothetical protein